MAEAGGTPMADWLDLACERPKAFDLAVHPPKVTV
jgi:hypothetical protein